MPSTAPLLRSAARLAGIVLAGLLAVALGACAALAGRDPLKVHLVGLEPLPGQGLEVRFAVKLRLQNPNQTAIDYDGLALDLELNGRPLGSGVSDDKGSVPRFGETVLTVPVSVSAFAMVRQAIGVAGGERLQDVPYVMRGKVATGALGLLRFSEEGTLSLPAPSRGSGG